MFCSPYSARLSVARCISKHAVVPAFVAALNIKFETYYNSTRKHSTQYVPSFCYSFYKYPRVNVSIKVLLTRSICTKRVIIHSYDAEA
jgi:hypothetical protein